MKAQPEYNPRRHSGVRWRGLTIQLFSLIILPLTALLLIITFGSLALHQSAMRGLVGERDERAVRIAAAAISDQLDHRGAMIENLADRVADQTPVQKILATLNDTLAEFDEGIAFFSSNGDLLASSSDNLWWIKAGGHTSEVLEQTIAKTEARAIFSAAVRSPNDNTYTVFVAARPTPEAIVTIGAFRPAHLASRMIGEAILPSPSFPRGQGTQAAVLMVDADRQILYQEGILAPAEQITTHPGVQDALEGRSGTTYVQVGKHEHVVAYSPVYPLGWALVIEEPWDTINSQLLNITQLAPLVLVPVLLLVLVALWFSVRQVIQPLQILEDRASELAWGDYTQIDAPVGGIDEIRHLQKTLSQLARKVKASQQSLRGYIGAITTGQEEERRRLARELHDDTLQSLIALNQRVQLASMNANSQKTTQQLEEIQELTEQTIKDLRRLIQALRPIYLEDLGLVAALDMLARETSQASSIPIQFLKEGVEQRLPLEVELSLYRMTQEGLSNVAKHAQASKALLKLTFIEHGVTIRINDDGVGFVKPDNPAELTGNGHFGLLGLYERADLIGAKLEINTEPGKGTELLVYYKSVSI